MNLVTPDPFRRELAARVYVEFTAYREELRETVHRSERQRQGFRLRA